MPKTTTTHHQPETVEEFSERVLYGPGGFYTTGGWTPERRARLAPIIAAVEARQAVAAQPR
ncbi:hypothetical protein [Pseudofrankia inefficax]|uniref:TRAP dicarboxylate transporter-DctP subunit n=1 Tax=Pseudofrankia inefficax (strain DSM 45817 / CECT 9037 / DDB 130130 / EuI1c) TaxID=298654 RepID=E3J737_PSEI1|nr:hypothetical protein [Pseudofrankia inefficax]ADP84401.1 TRAP dicarboxylate transporter-DctP subunit [Pseudofrankia inefficax]